MPLLRGRKSRDPELGSAERGQRRAEPYNLGSREASRTAPAVYSGVDLPTKPTIAHLLPWPAIGGVEVATLRLIRATEPEFRHVAFCLPDTPELQAACREAGAEVACYTPPTPSLRHFAAFYRQSQALARDLIRQGVDLIHCSEIKAVYHNSLAALLARRPLISHVRSRFPTLSLRDRLTFLPVSRYIFVSRDSRRQFALRVGDRKARILYDGITLPDRHTTPRAQLGLPPDAPLVGMVARINPQKDYDTLVDAAALVLAQRPDARFVVVGDHSAVELNRQHFAHVRARLAERGIEDRFLFTGFRSDVPEIVAALDVFVLCTHREGLPLSILEAMGMGKPVIATAVDGIPEVITHGVTGFLHAHGNSQELAALILSCLENPTEAMRIGRAALAHCRGAFSTEVFARNAVAMYRELLPLAR